MTSKETIKDIKALADQWDAVKALRDIIHPDLDVPDSIYRAVAQAADALTLLRDEVAYHRRHLAALEEADEAARQTPEPEPAYGRIVWRKP